MIVQYKVEAANDTEEVKVNVPAEVLGLVPLMAVAPGNMPVPAVPHPFKDAPLTVVVAPVAKTTPVMPEKLTVADVPEALADVLNSIATLPTPLAAILVSTTEVCVKVPANTGCHPAA
jgi:hypothetical protein